MTHQLPEDLFATGADLVPRMEVLGGKLPIILIDDVYENPSRVREAALELDYRTPHYPYPGRIAEISPDNLSLANLLRSLLDLVNTQYLARVPRIACGLSRLRPAFGRDRRRVDRNR